VGKSLRNIPASSSSRKEFHQPTTILLSRLQNWPTTPGRSPYPKLGMLETVSKAGYRWALYRELTQPFGMVLALGF
jgi:hypothetical protein